MTLSDQQINEILTLQEKEARLELNSYLQRVHAEKIKEKARLLTNADCGDCDPKEYPHCTKCLGS